MGEATLTKEDIDTILSEKNQKTERERSQQGPSTKEEDRERL